MPLLRGASWFKDLGASVQKLLGEKRLPAIFLCLLPATVAIPRLACSTPIVPTDDVTMTEVVASLKVLWTSQAPQPDNIQTAVLKGMSSVIAPTFAALFTFSMATKKLNGIQPSCVWQLKSQPHFATSGVVSPVLLGLHQ